MSAPITPISWRPATAARPTGCPAARRATSRGPSARASSRRWRSRPENLAGADGVTVDPPALTPPPQQPRQRETRTQEAKEAEQRSAETVGPGDDLLPRPTDDGGDQAQAAADKAAKQTGEYDDWVADQQRPSLLRQGQKQAPGDRGFDFRQEEQGRGRRDVDLDGDYSLSTYEWNFAPWMHAFVQSLYRSWIAPYAYRLGIIDGFTRIRLVVERDGRPSSLEIVAKEGNASLHMASVAALRAFARTHRCRLISPRISL